jgi:hypothetical protein
VTRQQERLSARLARAEARRIELTGGAPLSAAIDTLPAPMQALSASIRETVGELKHKQAATASLLQQSIELTDHTLTFLQRLVTPQVPVYGARGAASAHRQTSMLVDSRA